jgi:non-heme chloroperoxidase
MSRRWLSTISAALALGLLLLPGAALAQPAPALARTTGVVETIDGERLWYVEAGSGPAILFVPGWTMHAGIWEPQIRHFAARHRVVAMDPRAQGESSKATEGLYPAVRARDIKAVVDHLTLAPVVLVGWSMAVTEIAEYVGQFGTGDVSAIVLVDGIAGGPYDPVRTPAMLKWAAGFMEDRRGATRQFVKSMYRTPQPEAYLEEVVAASLKVPTSAAVALFPGALTDDNREHLAKIDRPTLLACAPGGPFDPAYADMQQRIPGARLEWFEGAGHALFVDQPAKFNAVLDEFLASAARK